jgi:hypothetical protein
MSVWSETAESKPTKPASALAWPARELAREELAEHALVAQKSIQARGEA